VQGLASLEGHAGDPTVSKATDRNPQPEPTATNTNTNRVYYATSVRLDDDEKPTSEKVRGRDSNALFDGNTSIRLIHLPPNRSDLMERFFAVPPPATNEAEMDDRNTCSSTDETEDDDDNDIDYRREYEDAVDLVVFDRFFMEEAHSFRFRQQFPSAALVLDMQDMHSLRWGRQKIVEEWDKRMLQQRQRERKEGKRDATAKDSTPNEEAVWDPMACLPEVLSYLPSVDEDDRLTRELASIHRSDLVLVCSPEEAELLKTIYRVPDDKLCVASFFVDPDAIDLCHHCDHCHYSTTMTSPSTAPRFVFCGGFKHAPNADAVRLLIDFVWPKLREELPEATLHIYGAYCPDHLLQINSHRKHKNESTRGITIHGFEPNLANIFGSQKHSDNNILLAPLRFGAGIKGKIIDAWTFGMPVVTTPIGSEGMTMCANEIQNNAEDDHSRVDDCFTPSKKASPNIIFGGLVASTLEDFCSSAVKLAKNPEEYRIAQRNGTRILQNRFSSSINWGNVQKSLLQVLTKDVLTEKRNGDYTQAMLWHQSMRSTEYFSRWVELKESLRRKKT